MDRHQPSTPTVSPEREDSARIKWQRALLPLMRRTIVGLSLFFFIATFGQLVYLHLNIDGESSLRGAQLFSPLDKQAHFTFEEGMKATQLQAMIALEAESLQRRHHQANVLLMSRVWARYLGFVTGMILAIIGGVFILGKMDTPMSEIGAEAAGTSFSFKSASPGLILAALGVCLMISTIAIHHEIEVSDSKIYTLGHGLYQANTGESSTMTLSADPPYSE